MDRKYAASVLAASLLFICAVQTHARAEVHLFGNSDELILEAKNATLREIVSGIQSSLNYKVSLTGSMTRQINGTYSGSLRHVLSRLLDGTDYVISSAGRRISIVLPGAGRHDHSQAPPQGAARDQIAASPVQVEYPLASDVQGWIGTPFGLVSSKDVSDRAKVPLLPDQRPISDTEGWAGTVRLTAPHLPDHL